MSESKRAWWTIPETGYNQDWPRPAFALGEMVWWRSDPREGVHVTGISLQEGWQDDKDNTWHDPFWQYQITQNYGWWSDNQFVAHAEHGAYLKAWLERLDIASQSNDFDPFLASDETLP